MSEKHNLHLRYISEDKFTKIVIQSLPPLSDPLTGWLSSLITLTPLLPLIRLSALLPSPQQCSFALLLAKTYFQMQSLASG